MKNLQKLLQMFAMLAAISSVLAAQDKPQQTNASSATNSPPSATAAKRNDLISACSNAVADLKATRTLVDSLDTESKLLRERLASEQQLTATLSELNATRKSENDALRTAIAAKNETINAKDAAIGSQAKLIESLKRKKSSILGRVGDVLAGAAAALIFVR